jgi:HYR domain
MGTPPGITNFTIFGGISADGETILVGTNLGIFLRNTAGWFNFQHLLANAGIDLSMWAFLEPAGFSSDAQLVYGIGTRTNGDREGFIVKLPPDFMKAYGDTSPPVLTLPGNLVVEATSAAGAVVNFSASAVDAVDGDVPVVYSQNPGTVFPLGSTTVRVSATDGAGNVASNSFTITVRDTTAPVITSLYASPALLWPPNHKMHAVTVNGTTSDAVGPVALRIVSIASNEPDNGLGDGDTANDVVITGALTASLRAERSGKGAGRFYTITIEARDAASNTSTSTVTVTVPRN